MPTKTPSEPTHRRLGDAVDLSDPDQLRHHYKAACTSVRGFQDATSRHGSLLQNLVQGQPLVMGNHYPEDDVDDSRTGSQYFYHSHRTEQSEHGHMHLFWHADRLGRRVRHRSSSPASCWAPSHLLAIGFDERGVPVSLFTTNLWVTGGHWFSAPQVIKMLDRFSLSERGKFGPVNRFTNGLLDLYRPLIVDLLKQRDKRIMALAGRGQQDKVLRNERHEVLSYFAIDWLADVDLLDQLATV